MTKGLRLWHRRKWATFTFCSTPSRTTRLFAPVKLERITRSKMQGDKRRSRSGVGTFEVSVKSLNRRIGSSIPLRDELFAKLRGRPPLPARPLLILPEQFLKSRVKSIAEIMPDRRRLPLIARRTVVLQILLHRVPRQTGGPRHRSDAATLDQYPTTDLRYTFHQYHLLIPPRWPARMRTWQVEQFYSLITHPSGAISHADAHPRCQTRVTC